MKFNYSTEKNAKLISERGIGFEEIIDATQQGNLLSITEHHNPDQYPNQYLLHVRCLEVVYVVPFVIEESGTLFLKTLYPSRKATKKYLS
jgi:uncharacterized DUF497 family protein